MSKDGRIWLSHTGLETLERCPRCFWLQYNKGIRQPEGIVSRLANRFDTVLKSYFDIYRPNGELPPMIADDVEGKLQNHFTQTYWVRLNDKYGFYGKLDECLENDKGQLIPLDFKTSSSDPREKELLPAYQSQIDDYLFVIAQNGKKTSGFGYLMFVFPDHGKKLHDRFPMIIHTVKVTGDPKKTKGRLKNAIKVLDGKIPKSSADCNFCDYIVRVNGEVK